MVKRWSVNPVTILGVHSIQRSSTCTRSER